MENKRLHTPGVYSTPPINKRRLPQPCCCRFLYFDTVEILVQTAMPPQRSKKKCKAPQRRNPKTKRCKKPCRKAQAVNPRTKRCVTKRYLRTLDSHADTGELGDFDEFAIDDTGELGDVGLVSDDSGDFGDVGSDAGVDLDDYVLLPPNQDDLGDQDGFDDGPHGFQGSAPPATPETPPPPPTPETPPTPPTVFKQNEIDDQSPRRVSFITPPRRVRFDIPPRGIDDPPPGNRFDNPPRRRAIDPPRGNPFDGPPRGTSFEDPPPFDERDSYEAKKRAKKRTKKRAKCLHRQPPLMTPHGETPLTTPHPSMKAISYEHEARKREKKKNTLI